MKIALISYEYPPATAEGGVATYVYHTAQMLHQRGHHVEVFTAAVQSHQVGTYTEPSGVIVHKVAMHPPARHDFKRVAGPVFAARHSQVAFDVLEGPERFCEAEIAVQLVPDIPLLVTLHGVGFLRQRVSTFKDSLQPETNPLPVPPTRDMFRFSQRSLRVVRMLDQERSHVLQADLVVSPSKAMLGLVNKLWQLESVPIASVPSAFAPPQPLLSIPVETDNWTVGYIGRLEQLKGVLDFCRAVPLILDRLPRVKFRFVGDTRQSPDPGMTMKEYMQQWLAPWENATEFVGKISSEELATELALIDVCALPSIYENFPYAVMESMAAGRAVIASRAGGGKEIVADAGLLVTPCRPSEIADAVVRLLSDRVLRYALGRSARDRILESYNFERIGALKESAMDQAIARRKALGPRISA